MVDNQSASIVVTSCPQEIRKNGMRMNLLRLCCVRLTRHLYGPSFLQFEIVPARGGNIGIIR
jgi:hypothetical protein